jgi:hypothetical protein
VVKDDLVRGVLQLDEFQAVALRPNAGVEFPLGRVASAANKAKGSLSAGATQFGGTGE